MLCSVKYHISKGRYNGISQLLMKLINLIFQQIVPKSSDTVHPTGIICTKQLGTNKQNHEKWT